MYYRGLDESEMAALVNVNRATVYRWRAGTAVMSAAHAAAVAETLNAPSDLFLRPPETRERALAMMAAWDAARGDVLPPG